MIQKAIHILVYLRVCFDETQGYEPGVYLYLSFYDWTVKSNYSFSVYMDNALLLQGMCSDYLEDSKGWAYKYIFIPLQYFKRTESSACYNNVYNESFRTNRR